MLEADLQNPAFRPYQPARVWVGKGYCPIVDDLRKKKPGVPLVRRPGSSARTRRNHGSRTAGFATAGIAGIAQPVDCPGEWRWRGELPGLSAVAGTSHVVRKTVWFENFAAAENAMEGVTKIDAGHAGCRSTLDDRGVVGLPAVAPVRGSENSGIRGAAGADPCAVFAFGGDASAAGCKGSFPHEGGRQSVPNVLPGLSVSGADNREAAVDRIGHGDAACRTPKCEAIVKFGVVLVLKLQSPGVAAVFGLVDTGIGPSARR